MKLSTRLSLAMLALVLFTATAVAVFTYRDLEAAILPRALERLESRATLQAVELESYVRAARNDVLGNRGAYLIEGIIRAHTAGGIDPADGSSLGAMTERLSRRFVTELESKLAYLQIRIIGRADGGREVLRVERSPVDGTIRAVPEAELQRTGDRDYVQETIALPAASVYVSPIELNQERGFVETPQVPILRIATPLHTADGEPFGIFIITVDMRPAFDRIRNSAPADASVYVVNERGEYLVHPDRSREFAFERGRGETLQDRFPAIAGMLGAAGSEARVTTDVDGESIALATARADFGGGRRVTFVESVLHPAVMQPVAAARRSLILATLAAALAATAWAIFLARSMSRPLVQMTAAVETFGRSGELPAPISAGGEVGVLARAFERMAADLRQRSAKIKEYARRERFYVAAVESSNYAFITVDPVGTITAWNPGAERLFGFVADEAVGQPLALIIPEDKRAEAVANREKINRRERVANLETVRVAKDGRRISVVIDGSPIVSRSGIVLGSAIIARDVSGKKIAQDMFRLAVESCPSGMVMFDRGNRIVLVNSEMERLFGYSRDELMNQRVDLLVPGGLGTGPDRNDAPRLPPNGHGDLVGVRKDGTKFPVEVHSNPIKIQDGVLALGVIVDVSERRKNERLKDEFVSTVSHELRTPLTSIAGSLGLLTGGAAGQMSEPTMRLLKIAHKNSERLVRLINDILDIEKIESGKVVFDLKRVDARALVEQALDANRGFAESFGVRVELDPTAVPAFVRADPDRFVQVITNLLSNAIKFSPRGGTVVVALDERADDVRISVRDHGCGIPEEFKPRIFEKFAQADASDARQKGGTGLGLSIVKQIVTLLGGTVGFDSPEGGGTIFHVDLPRWGIGGEEAAVEPTRARVLICDDDASVAKALADRLSPQGFVVDTALSAGEALAQAQAAQYDAILVDLTLPDRDGIGLIQDLRSQPPYHNTPIVVISADAARGRDDIRSASLNVLDWLNKPIDIAALVAVLNRPIARNGCKRPRLLHIDDDAGVLGFVAQAVGASCEVTSVAAIADARAALAARRFDLVVLDLMLSQASGLDLLPELRDRDGNALPVILYSAPAANGANAAQVRAALTKSHHAIDHLILTLRRHMAGRPVLAQQTREVA